MRVLCCLDGTNVEQVSKATELFLSTQSLTLGILYVVDTGPRKDIEHTRERFLRPPGPPGPREHEMEQAEHAAAEDILNEALRHFPNAETFQGHGGQPAIGPKSVGHVARFVFGPCSLSGAAGSDVDTRAISYCQVNYAPERRPFNRRRESTINTLLEVANIAPAFPGGTESGRISGMRNWRKSRYGDSVNARKPL